MRSYQRVFGTGPRGVTLSLGTLATAWGLEGVLGLPVVHGHDQFGVTVLAISVALTTLGALWSLKSLPLESRGREFVTQGAFHYVRHPLYAAFLLSFNFGLALYLDGWLYIAWAVLQFPLWHANVVGEERLMQEAFGDAYTVYCRRTGRFVPKWTALTGRVSSP